jgi:recombination protein RecA
MSQALRILNPVISRTKTCIIFINQIRQKIGVMFGNPETTAGGLALKFYASVRLDVRKISTIKEGEDNVGARIKAKVVKNKIAPPFRSTEFDLMFDQGISRTGDLIDLGVEDGFIEKTGAWLNYGTSRLGQGRENSKQFLNDNPKILDEITRKILAKRVPEMAGHAAAEEKITVEKNGKPEPVHAGGKKGKSGE